LSAAGKGNREEEGGFPETEKDKEKKNKKERSRRVKKKKTKERNHKKKKLGQKKRIQGVDERTAVNFGHPML